MSTTTTTAAVHVTPSGTVLELACSHVTPNHSSDHVSVSAGREPVWVCGYHAAHFLHETLNGIAVLTK